MARRRKAGATSGIAHPLHRLSEFGRLFLKNLLFIVSIGSHILSGRNVMFEVKANGNRLEISMSGQLDGPAMKQALDDLERESSSIQDGTMLYDAVDYHLPTLDAIFMEFSRLPSMLGLMGRFRKAALLSDMGWLSAISEAEGLMFPGLTIKAFKRDERQAAIDWLEQ